MAPPSMGKFWRKPLDSDKLEIPHGELHIIKERCKGCGFCIEFCPPKVLAFSDKYNTHGYHPPHLTNEAGCTGCDLCGLYCPDFAIFGVRVPIAAEGAEVNSVKE